MTTAFLVEELFHIRDAEGCYLQASPDQILDAARGIADRRLKRGVKMCSPDIAGDYLSIKLGTLDYEVFVVLFLDSQHQLIECVEMFRGTIDGAAVYPREVVREALVRNAAAVMFAHNHPSGSLSPSTSDQKITERLRDALSLFDIRVLDHIVVGGGTFSAFSKLGLL